MSACMTLYCPWMVKPALPVDQDTEIAPGEGGGLGVPAPVMMGQIPESVGISTPTGVQSPANPQTPLGGGVGLSNFPPSAAKSATPDRNELELAIHSSAKVAPLPPSVAPVGNNPERLKQSLLNLQSSEMCSTPVLWAKDVVLLPDVTYTGFVSVKGEPVGFGSLRYFSHEAYQPRPKRYSAPKLLVRHQKPSYCVASWNASPSTVTWFGIRRQPPPQRKAVAVFTGTLHNGRRHGLGSMTFDNGTACSGCWQDDFQHGAGAERRANGVTYFGRFVLGLWNGHGILLQPHENQFSTLEGIFADGKVEAAGLKGLTPCNTFAPTRQQYCTYINGHPVLMQPFEPSFKHQAVLAESVVGVCMLAADMHRASKALVELFQGVVEASVRIGQGHINQKRGTHAYIRPLNDGLEIRKHLATSVDPSKLAALEMAMIASAVEELVVVSSGNKNPEKQDVFFTLNEIPKPVSVGLILSDDWDAYDAGDYMMNQLQRCVKRDVGNALVLHPDRVVIADVENLTGTRKLGVMIHILPDPFGDGPSPWILANNLIVQTKFPHSQLRTGLFTRTARQFRPPKEVEGRLMWKLRPQRAQGDKNQPSPKMPVPTVPSADPARARSDLEHPPWQTSQDYWPDGSPTQQIRTRTWREEAVHSTAMQFLQQRNTSPSHSHTALSPNTRSSLTRTNLTPPHTASATGLKGSASPSKSVTGLQVMPLDMSRIHASNLVSPMTAQHGSKLPGLSSRSLRKSLVPGAEEPPSPIPAVGADGLPPPQPLSREYKDTAAPADRILRQMSPSKERPESTVSGGTTGPSPTRRTEDPLSTITSVVTDSEPDILREVERKRKALRTLLNKGESSRLSAGRGRYSMPTSEGQHIEVVMVPDVATPPSHLAATDFSIRGSSTALNSHRVPRREHKASAILAAQQSRERGEGLYTSRESRNGADGERAGNNQPPLSAGWKSAQMQTVMAYAEVVSPWSRRNSADGSSRRNSTERAQPMPHQGSRPGSLSPPQAHYGSSRDGRARERAQLPDVQSAGMYGSWTSSPDKAPHVAGSGHLHWPGRGEEEHANGRGLHASDRDRALGMSSTGPGSAWRDRDRDRSPAGIEGGSGYGQPSMPSMGVTPVHNPRMSMTRDDYHRGLTTPSNFDFSPVGTDSRSFVYHGRQVA